MNVGPFSLPVPPLIFFISVMVSLFAGWLFRRNRANVDGAVFGETAAEGADDWVADDFGAGVWGAAA